VPQREPNAPPVVIPTAELARIKDLYLQGRYRTAFEAGQAFGPLRTWSGPAARLIAGRLAMQLGTPRLGRQLQAVAFRESPAYPEAVYYHARFRMERFGPLGCWRFMRQHTDWSEASPEIRGDWLALQGFVASRFRDFDRAERFLAQSESTCPGRPWHYVERSSVLEAQDLLDDALTAARRSLELQPWFRPGVQAFAHLLTRKGRETEALEFLIEAADRLESGMVAAQLATVQWDQRLYADARRSFERFAELSPLMDSEVAQWLAARRTDVCYLLGEYSAAAEHVRGVGQEDKFYQAFATKLETLASLQSDPTPLPPLQFGEEKVVSEHTEYRCILPLELAYETPPPQPYELLGRFWKTTAPNADGLMWSDGLPNVEERRRFEAAGWVCREFTFTFDAADMLIRRGLPFLATFFEAGFGQPRFVIGIDSARESVFLIESVERKPVEAPMRTITERFTATGPRAFVAVPSAQAELLRGLTLPDADWHDRLHTMQSMLADRRFVDAKREWDLLSIAAPSHLVTKLAAMAWAKGTGHPVLLLDAVNALLVDCPRDPTFGIAKANALRDLGRMHDRNAFLQDAGSRSDADPILLQSQAQILLTNPHEQDEVDRLLRLSVRNRPHAPAGYFLLAAHRWEKQQFEESVELHRIACCLDDREEQFAEAYVRVARVTGQMSDAIRLLQQQVRRSDTPTPSAVRSLVHALTERGETEFAGMALEKAIGKLAASPASKASLAELRLFQAEMLANHGKASEAEAALTAAKADAPPAAWYKSAARVARTRPDFRATLGHLKNLLDTEPLNTDAQRLYAGVLSDTEGKAAVNRYLNELCTRFPYFYPALRMRAEFLSTEPDENAISATRELIDLCPHDAWAHRQLALVYGDRRRLPEALAAAAVAGEHDSNHPSYFAVLANILRRADRTEEAVAAFRSGLTRYVDHELAIAELVRTARGLKEKQAALGFIREQLHVQVTNGEGLLAYRDQTLPLITGPEDQEQLLAELEQFLDERPDLWQAWSLVIQQLLMSHRGEEAYALAKQATARFPLLSRLWMDLAEACRASSHTDERADAIRQAIACAPGWTQAAKELADALGEQGEYDAATAVLEANVVRTSMDPFAHMFLAERLWNSDRGEDALRHAEIAVRHEPGYDWAWAAVANWGERLDRPDAALELARTLAIDRAGDPRVFIKLARYLYKYEQTDEALAALDRAIALEPKNPEPYDLKAERLADVGRYDEAMSAAHPAELLDDLPLTLRGRAAWVDARRENYAAAIPAMQALVSVDPQYYWGWSQLAEWYNETGKGDAYLEAAEEMIRLHPDHPTPLAKRGEARLQTGNREGGKADLREALRLHPGYSPAAAILFDACLADNELKEARAALSVLQEHMTGPEVIVKQLEYAVRTQDEEAAARAFEDICRAEGEGPPSALQMALQKMRAAGLEERSVKLMGEAWRSGEPFNPWAGLLWLDTPAGDDASEDEKLAACDAVLRQYPRFIPAYDRKAEQLARMGRFDEARETCRANGLTPEPLTLRGRAAWVEAFRGDKERAIKMMTACLDQDPEYTWGWRQLAHWYDELGRPADCLTAAEQLVKLAPHDPYAYGIRGEAKRILGDHRGALEDFQRAYDLDPDFSAAGHQLISEQLTTDDLSGAARTLSTMRNHSDGPLLQVRAVQLAARQKNLTQARSALRALATDPEVHPAMLSDAAQALDEAHWSREADEELSAALEDEHGTPATAAVWSKRLIAAGQGWKVGDRLKELTDNNPNTGREAVLVYAWAMAVTGQPETAAATVQRFADLIRRDDEGWGRAGATLAEVKKYPLAVAWLQGWEERPGCEPWMLRALADSYRALGHDGDAHSTLVAAELLADDAEEELPEDMRAWLALGEALAGNETEARDHLDQLETTGQTDAVALLMTLTKSLLSVHSAPDKANAFQNAQADIRSAADACPPAEYPPGLVRVYQQVVSKLAADAGGMKAKLWAWWQKVRPLVKRS
jgi:tetratricopeptide (TPR) repeat protein